MQKNKGFTIIELIVVIAIIAVLAGIVLVNVQSYVKKSRDASTKAQMKEYIKNAAVYYEKNGSYTGLGSDPTASNLYIGMQYNTPSPGWVAPIISSTNFCLRVNLNSGGQWCGDSSGNVKEISLAQWCTSTDGYVTFYCP